MVIRKTPEIIGNMTLLRDDIAKVMGGSHPAVAQVQKLIASAHCYPEKRFEYLRMAAELHEQHCGD